MCAVYRNRMIYLQTWLFIVLLVLTLFIDKIYAAIGQDPAIAAYGA